MITHFYDQFIWFLSSKYQSIWVFSLVWRTTGWKSKWLYKYSFAVEFIFLNGWKPCGWKSKRIEYLSKISTRRLNPSYSTLQYQHSSIKISQCHRYSKETFGAASKRRSDDKITLFSRKETRYTDGWFLKAILITITRKKKTYSVYFIVRKRCQGRKRRWFQRK